MSRHLKPNFEDDYEGEDLDRILQEEESEKEESEDELSTLSFGALKKAQHRMDQTDREESRKGKKSHIMKAKSYDIDSGSDSEGFFEDERQSKSQKRNKHAPSESSSKRRVSKIRQIPGLENSRQSTLYQDIRFDTALGKANLNRIRKDYKFLDEYREKEIKEIQSMIKDPKMRRKMDDREVQDLEYEAKSLKSRLESLKNRDLEQQILKEYQEEHKSKDGNKFYLKNSEKRKIIQKYKFDHMKSKQREKVVERKRKRRLGKEFKQLEFNRPQ